MIDIGIDIVDVLRIQDKVLTLLQQCILICGNGDGGDHFVHRNTVFSSFVQCYFTYNVLSYCCSDDVDHLIHRNIVLSSAVTSMLCGQNHAW